MAELSLKQEFVRLLHEVVRGGGMAGVELADRLGISASALSQMLSGKLLPTLPRLDMLVEALHPNADTAKRLQDMLLWLRSGCAGRPSDFNRRLFMVRCEKSLSVEQLAERAAIPVARVRRMERTAYAVPTAGELAALNSALGAELDVKAGGEPGGGVPSFDAAEANEEMLPLIPVEALEEAAGRGEDVLAEVLSCGMDFVALRGVPPEAAAVVRSGAARFGVAMPGTLELVLGRKRPRGFVDIALCADGEGRGLFVTGAAPLFGGAGDEGRQAAKNAAWRLPVLRMNYIPERVEDGH